MICGAKTRLGHACQKYGMTNGRCRLHGGLSPSGKNHWNWQHGKATKEYRRASAEAGSRVRMLELIAIELEMM